jgi:hypothetical protein
MPAYMLNEDGRLRLRARPAAWITVLFCFLGCAETAAKPRADNSGAENDALVSPLMCPALGDMCRVTPPSYKDTIAPIIAARCASCHTGVGNAPWPLDTWDDLAEWADLVATSVDGCTMPPSDAGVPFTAGERESLRTWLICGAPNN